MRDDTSASGRIAGLDLWRGLLMLAGLPVHASFALPRVALFDVVEDVSLGFRMGAFFAISGLLSALALRRRGGREWLAGRAVQLGIPCAVAILLFSPLIAWLTATAGPGHAMRVLLPFEWHHAWFLPALFLYSATALALDRADRRSVAALRWPPGWEGAAGGRIAILVTAGSGALLAWAAGSVVAAVLPTHWLVPFANLQMIAGYWPMFVLGFAAARRPALTRALLGATRFALAIVLLSAAAYAAVRWLDAGAIVSLRDERDYALVRFLIGTTTPPAAFVLILRSALTVRAAPAWAQRLSAASYTIYLVHLPIMVAINTRAPGDWAPYATFAVSIVAGGALALWLHERVVVRSPMLALLLNGRRPPTGTTVQWTKRATTSR